MTRHGARHANLWIFSEDISAAEMETLLALHPDRTEVKGVTPPGYRNPASAHCWAVRVDGDDDADVSTLVESLLDRVRPVAGAIESLVRRGCEVRFDIVIHSSPEDRDSPGFILGPQAIAELNQMRATLQVDQYVNHERFDVMNEAAMKVFMEREQRGP